MEVDRLQVASRCHEPTGTLRAGAGGEDLQLPGAVLDRVEHPEVGAGVVDDPPPIAAGEPGVESLVVGVPLQPRPVGVTE